MTSEIPPSFYTFKNFSEVLPRGFKREFEISGVTKPNHKDDRSSSFLLESDNISLINKLILRYEIRILRFERKSFFYTILDFSPYWYYKSDNEHFSEKKKIICTIDKLHLKCDVIDGSIVGSLRQPNIYSFVIDKPSGYKVFSEPETIHNEKVNKSVLNTITFHLEDDNHEKVNFNEKR